MSETRIRDGQSFTTTGPAAAFAAKLIVHQQLFIPSLPHTRIPNTYLCLEHTRKHTHTHISGYVLGNQHLEKSESEPTKLAWLSIFLNSDLPVKQHDKKKRKTRNTSMFPCKHKHTSAKRQSCKPGFAVQNRQNRVFAGHLPCFVFSSSWYSIPKNDSPSPPLGVKQFSTQNHAAPISHKPPPYNSEVRSVR